MQLCLCTISFYELEIVKSIWHPLSKSSTQESNTKTFWKEEYKSKWNPLPHYYKIITKMWLALITKNYEVKCAYLLDWIFPFREYSDTVRNIRSVRTEWSNTISELMIRHFVSCVYVLETGHFKKFINLQWSQFI